MVDICRSFFLLVVLCCCQTQAFNQLSFEDFQFARNGVCVQPAFFTCPSPKATFTLKNIPGTGDCMFQAVTLASLTSMGLGGNDALLRAISRETRSVVAQVLQSDGNLFIEGNRVVKAKDLLKSAAKGEGLTPDKYLEQLLLEGRDGGLYGGGPELTALSNVLRRPISVYEIDNTQTTYNENECPIECKGVFGDRFKDPCFEIPNSAVLSGLQPGAYSWHLHVLVMDVFSMGVKHACVLLPQEIETN